MAAVNWSKEDIATLKVNVHLHADELALILPHKGRRSVIKKLKALGLFNAETHTIVRSKIGDVYGKWTILGFETMVKSKGKKIRAVN